MPADTAAAAAAADVSAVRLEGITDATRATISAAS
jgi:hypothetical protein